MAYVIGGRGLPDYTQLLSSLVPDVIQRVGVYIEWPEIRNHPDNSPLKKLLTQVDPDALSRGLALRVVTVNPTEDVIEVPTAKVYGNRTIFGPPVINQPTSMSVVFVETRKPSPRDIMRTWHNTIYSWTNGISWHYVPPELQATLYYYVFTPDLKAIERKEVYYGVYPSNAPSDAINTNVSDTDFVTFTQEFRFSVKKVWRNISDPNNEPYAKAIIETIYANQVTTE